MPARRVVTWSVAVVLSLLTVGLVGCGGSGAGGTRNIVTHTIGGTLSGLAVGQTITLMNNGGDSLTLTASGSFTFATPVSDNGAYAVTVGVQPAWQTCAVTAASGSAVTNITAVSVDCSYKAALALVAGHTTGPGSSDGGDGQVRFDHAQGVAVDASGNVYVADTDNSTIRRISPAGVVTTIAGSAGLSGNADGVGSAARFCYPSSVTIDSAGDVYVADTCNLAIRKVTPAGVVTTVASGLTAWAGIAVDRSGNFYLAEQGRGRIIKVTPTGGVTDFATGFNTPWGVAVDDAGFVYLADTQNHVIRKITPAGVVSTLAGAVGIEGSADGTGSAARFLAPYGVAVDGNGNVYTTSNGTVRKITSAGVVSTIAGTPGVVGSADGTGPAASFAYSTNLAVDSAGNVYVADFWNSTIRMVTPAGVVTTIGGTPPVQGGIDGVGPAASFWAPWGMAADAAGYVYVADSGPSTIRKISPTGAVSTLAGMAGNKGASDGTGAAASFTNPYGVAVDGSRNVYVADAGNHTVRKITPGGVVTTLAGLAGASGSTDGTGSAARFKQPTGIAVDNAGNVYVSDGVAYTIRKITATGVVTTLAGMAGGAGSADGTAGYARFANPQGVAVDGSGTVFVADYGNYTIRKVTAAGEVTTLAGTALVAGSADGTGAAARFRGPQGIALDSAGNLYVADGPNHTIRKITPAGAVTTVVGTAGVNGFQPGDLPGVIGFPYGVAVVDTRIYFTTYDAIAVATGVR